VSQNLNFHTLCNWHNISIIVSEFLYTVHTYTDPSDSLNLLKMRSEDTKHVSVL